MQFLAAHAVKLNCVRFDWTTEETNPGAMAFYARLGAERVKEKVYYRLTGSALLALATGGLPGHNRDDA
jgi:ribosomal protein S18 acetylase RimI-like enzyme